MGITATTAEPVSGRGRGEVWVPEGRDCSVHALAVSFTRLVMALLDECRTVVQLLFKVFDLKLDLQSTAVVRNNSDS